MSDLVAPVDLAVENWRNGNRKDAIQQAVRLYPEQLLSFGMLIVRGQSEPSIATAIRACITHAYIAGVAAERVRPPAVPEGWEVVPKGWPDWLGRPWPPAKERYRWASYEPVWDAATVLPTRLVGVLRSGHSWVNEASGELEKINSWMQFLRLPHRVVFGWKNVGRLTMQRMHWAFRDIGVEWPEDGCIDE